jgi:hypothetical protein
MNEWFCEAVTSITFYQRELYFVDSPHWGAKRCTDFSGHVCNRIPMSSSFSSVSTDRFLDLFLSSTDPVERNFVTIASHGHVLRGYFRHEERCTEVLYRNGSYSTPCMFLTLFHTTLRTVFLCISRTTR